MGIFSLLNRQGRGTAPSSLLEACRRIQPLAIAGVGIHLERWDIIIQGARSHKQHDTDGVCVGGVVRGWGWRWGGYVHRYMY